MGYSNYYPKNQYAVDKQYIYLTDLVTSFVGFDQVFRAQAALVVVPRKVPFLNSFFELYIPEGFKFPDTASWAANICSFKDGTAKLMVC